MSERVFTYYVQSPNLPYYGPLFRLWSDSWELQGWEPVVLDETDAQRHPLYEKVKAHVSTLPTVNDLTYTVNDYLRWLALDTVGGGMATDSDVINYGYRPDSPDASELDFHEIDEGDVVPSMVHATREGLRQVVEGMLAYKKEHAVSIQGRPHCSDMLYFNHELVRIGRHCSTVKLFGSPGWEQSPCVHYASDAVRKFFGDHSIPKPDFPRYIQQVRPIDGFN